MSKILLVEGKNDISFYGAYSSYLGLDDIEIHLIDGSDKATVSGKLKTAASKTPKWLGLILDADNNREEKNKMISELANEFQFQFNPFIIPHIGSGELETVLLKIIKDSKIKQCIDSFFSCLEISFSKIDKAKHYTYLLAKCDHNYNGSIKKKTSTEPSQFWDLNASELNELKTFLESSKNA
jgi:hypothetical protein